MKHNILTFILLTISLTISAASFKVKVRNPGQFTQTHLPVVLKLDNYNKIHPRERTRPWSSGTSSTRDRSGTTEWTSSTSSRTSEGEWESVWDGESGERVCGTKRVCSLQMQWGPHWSSAGARASEHPGQGAHAHWSAAWKHLRGELCIRFENTRDSHETTLVWFSVCFLGNLDLPLQ